MMHNENYLTLKTEVLESRIMVVSLNRPESINALNNTMLDELLDITTKLIDHKEISVVILRGEGEKGFCGGLDVKNVFPPQVIAVAANLYDSQLKQAAIVANMRKMPQVIIAALHGACVGGGFIYAMAADIRIISNDAKFSAPFVKINMGGADLGTSYFLPRLVGAGVAYDLLLTGRFMRAEEAMRLGFASQCVETDQLMSTALTRAKEILNVDPLILRLTKEALNVNLDTGSLDSAMALEHRNQQMIGNHLFGSRK